MWNLLAKWYHRPSDYKQDRMQFLKRYWIIGILLVITLGILFSTFHVYDSVYTMPILGGIIIICFTVTSIRDKNKNYVEWYYKWWCGEYSKWSIIWKW
jgi:hypothetical protein